MVVDGVVCGLLCLFVFLFVFFCGFVGGIDCCNFFFQVFLFLKFVLQVLFNVGLVWCVVRWLICEIELIIVGLQCNVWFVKSFFVFLLYWGVVCVLRSILVLLFVQLVGWECFCYFLYLLQLNCQKFKELDGCVFMGVEYVV